MLALTKLDGWFSLRIFLQLLNFITYENTEDHSTVFWYAVCYSVITCHSTALYPKVVEVETHLKYHWTRFCSYDTPSWYVETELPKAGSLTLMSFLLLSEAGKTMFFPLKSKPLWLPASAANRIKLNTYQVEVWFPKEARHIKIFGLSSWKSSGKLWKPKLSCSLSSQSSLFSMNECVISTSKTGLQSILGATPTHNQIHTQQCNYMF